MPLTSESLFELKKFFDKQLETTFSSLKVTDSDRLRRNKINGFLIILQDKMFELKPKLMCSTCGKAEPTNDKAATK